MFVQAVGFIGLLVLSDYLDFSTAEKPNIIFFLADDVGWRYVSEDFA